MIFLLDYLAKIIHEQSLLLYTWIGNWYTIIFIYFLLYQGVHWLTKQITQHENAKREQIAQEIQKVKQEWAYENDGKKIEDFMIHQPTEKDWAFKEKAYQIIHVHKGKPHRIFIAHLVHIFMLIVCMWYFKSIHVIDPTIYLSFLSAILTFFTNLTKKKWWINFIAALFIAVCFPLLSGALNVFYLLLAGTRWIVSFQKKNNQKRVEKA